MVRLLRRLLAGAGGPAAKPRRRRQQRAEAASRRLREVARGAAAGEAAGRPARLLQGEARHGAVDLEVGLIGDQKSDDEASDSPQPSVRSNHSRRPRLSSESHGHDGNARGQGNAKTSILEADSIGSMFEIAEAEIEEDWLRDVDELPGNIYRIAALGTLTDKVCVWDADPSVIVMRLVRLMGFITIFLIQISGPPLLIASVYFRWGDVAQNHKDGGIHWDEWKPSFSDWFHIRTTKMLSTLFLFVFSINGLYTILQEKHSWAKIYKTFRYLKYHTGIMDSRCEYFLVLDAFTNTWVILLTCIASFTILGASFSPRNVLFDALGLLFLYNLDDVDGDLGFVSQDDWDGLRLGWIYREMVQRDKIYRMSTVCDEQSEYDPQDVGRTGRVVLRLYDIVSVLLAVGALVMPSVALFTPFLAIVPEGFD